MGTEIFKSSFRFRWKMNAQMNTLFIALLVTSVLFLNSCSSSDSDVLSGSTVIAGQESSEPSTLTLTVISSNNTLLGGAAVIVNGELKARTRNYGAKGTTTIVLKEGDNTLLIEKSGYQPYEFTVLGHPGNQEATIMLEEEKVRYTFTVIDSHGHLPGADASLFEGYRLAASTVSDGEGRVAFNIDAGTYRLRVSKEGYTPITEEISFSEAGSATITLSPVAQLVVEIYAQEERLQSAQVSLYEWENYHHIDSYPLAAKFTDEQGQVLFSSVEEGKRYVLVVKHDQYLSEIKDITLTPDNFRVHISLTPLG